MYTTRLEYENLLREGKKKPKIKLLYDGTCSHFFNGTTRFFLEQASLLAEFHNIHLIQPGDKPDLLWISSDKFNHEHLKHNLPIIIEDVFQAPDISAQCREIIQHEQVKVFLKAMMVQDHNIHNKQLHNYSIHQNQIGDLAKIEAPYGAIYPLMTPQMYKKVKLSWNFLAWPHFRHGFSHDCVSLRHYFVDNHTTPKEYDVTFIGNTSNWPDTVPLLKHHRQQAFKVLLNCPGNNVIHNKGMGWHKYWDILCKSKVVVSPWGWEPITLRDIEAILAGCILIKPQTSFVRTHPHLPSIYCNVDFSNLPALIQMALDHWESSEQFRTSAYKNLYLASNNFPNHIYEIISGVMDQR